MIAWLQSHTRYSHSWALAVIPDWVDCHVTFALMSREEAVPRASCYRASTAPVERQGKVGRYLSTPPPGPESCGAPLFYAPWAAHAVGYSRPFATPLDVHPGCADGPGRRHLYSTVFQTANENPSRLVVAALPLLASVRSFARLLRHPEATLHECPTALGKRSFRSVDCMLATATIYLFFSCQGTVLHLQLPLPWATPVGTSDRRVGAAAAAR